MRHIADSKESLGPNFVSGQWSTCTLNSERVGEARWSYVLRGAYAISAGYPEGPDPGLALASFLQWCREQGHSPLLFACEQHDLAQLKNWDVTEIGRQPLFCAGPSFDPDLSGKFQPSTHRKLRRQARRALTKGIIVEELDLMTLWEYYEAGAFDTMFFQRWKRRGLADFTFLVEFRMELGQRARRTFIARSEDKQVPLALAFLVPSQRGWLVEHQILSPHAPNGTAELMLCRFLSSFLEPGTVLSLGITPLFRELQCPQEHCLTKGILDFVPRNLKARLIESWESFYGFKSLLHFRTKLEPEVWEPVYWAVPKRRTFLDIVAVLRAFAGGPLVKFGLKSVSKRLHRFALQIRTSLLLKINLFYIVTLFLWIPILWNLNGVPLFGNALACKMWAIYDIFLLLLFCLQHRIIKSGSPGFVSDLLLGMVMADSLLAWIQTALFHGGLPPTLPLQCLVVVLNTAPLTALLFIVLVKYATKPVPFQRREMLRI